MCCKKKKSTDCLPLVDVEVPLHIERDQFGRATAVGKPKDGPKHGVGSYWYQVGYMWAAAFAQNNFAPIVRGYLAAAGRSSEFIVGQPVGPDIHQRRITLTQVQTQAQIDSQKNIDYPEDILDYVHGINQANLDHIVKIENGEEPLPADFVEGVGILNWFWQERNLVAPTLFTNVNFVNLIMISNDGFGSVLTTAVQLINTMRQINAVSVDPSGGLFTNQIVDDSLGVPGFNYRFTAAEGDRTGIYCPSIVPNTACPCDNRDIPTRSNLISASAVFKSRAIQEACVKRLKECTDELLENCKIRHAIESDWLIVGPELTKDKSTMMWHNSQVSIGFDPGSGRGTYRPSHNTPRGATTLPSYTQGQYIRSSTGYVVNLALEVTLRASRDGVFEDSKNLTLLYNSQTDMENVPGGKEHSRIKVRQANGTVTEFFTTIYQGKNLAALEYDFRFPDPNDPNNEFVYMERTPCDFSTQVGGYLKALATTNGLIPFDSLEELAELYSTTPLVVMYGGIDNRGNIFTMSAGLHPTIPQSDFNRFFPGDATSSQFFANMAARPLPYIQDNEYICEGARFVKNPKCGFFAAWNNMWSNNDQTYGGSYQELARVGSQFRDVTGQIDEHGRLDYQELRDLWSRLTLQRDGVGVLGTDQIYGMNAFPVVFKDDLFAALKDKGIAVGLTQDEIDRTLSLLGDNYDGRSIPNVDQEDLLNGTNYDGRWVLSQLWISFLGRNLWFAAVPDQLFATVVGSVSSAHLEITEPTGDWTQATPNQSRVITTRINSSTGFSFAALTGTASMLLRILKIGPDLGNPVFYDWYGQVLASTGLDLNNPDDRNFFIALALKDALTNLVTGSNLGTGLDDPMTGRANLNLIQDDGIPLHAGWGKNQRPITISGPPFVAPYATQYLIDNFMVRTDVSTLNRQGQLFYAERDCNGCLKHFQSTAQVGYSSLLTVNEINGQNVVTVQPHATDMAIYFEGNFQTDEIPFDIKKKCHCK